MLRLPVKYPHGRCGTVRWLPPGVHNNNIVKDPARVLSPLARIKLCMDWETKTMENNPVLKEAFGYLRCLYCKAIVLLIGDATFLECGFCGMVPHSDCELKRNGNIRYECGQCFKRDYTRGGTTRASVKSQLYDQKLPCDECGLEFVSSKTNSICGPE